MVSHFKVGYLLTLMFLMVSSTQVIASTCFGTTSQGRIENAVKLPSEGENFNSYGKIPELVGRTYVHSKVKKIVVEAYQALHKSMPDKVFIYAETGLKNGGKFKPHKTHQNGLSVDFMVPVVDETGMSVYLPTTPFNKYGYNIEFDSRGRYEKYKIDFEALAAHIVALHKKALENGADIWRVIFAPGLQKFLYETTSGIYIKDNILIPTKKSWVRHDEHYHVDFQVPCEPYR